MNAFEKYLTAKEKVAQAKAELENAKEGLIAHIGEGQSEAYNGVLYTAVGETVTTKSSYAKAFRLALTKVNPATKKVLQGVLLETQYPSKVNAQIKTRKAKQPTA